LATVCGKGVGRFRPVIEGVLRLGRLAARAGGDAPPSLRRRLDGAERVSPALPEAPPLEPLVERLVPTRRQPQLQLRLIPSAGGGEGTPQVLVGVSDKMKSRGRQAFSCLEKDQSFHLFAIP